MLWSITTKGQIAERKMGNIIYFSNRPIFTYGMITLPIIFNHYPCAHSTDFVGGRINLSRGNEIYSASARILKNSASSDI